MNYAFVFHETLNFFLDKKTPPELFQRIIQLLSRLFLNDDDEIQLEACKNLIFYQKNKNNN